jgi:hypothetical protein
MALASTNMGPQSKTQECPVETLGSPPNVRLYLRVILSEVLYLNVLQDDVHLLFILQGRALSVVVPID